MHASTLSSPASSISAAEAVQITDAALLAAFAAGDREALGQLAARYERMLLGFACGLCVGNEAAARDRVQSMWVKVIRSAASFEGRSELKTWLYQILINECRTATTRALVRRQNERQATGSVKGPVEDDSLARLRMAVASLDTPLREAILLCYHQGLTREQAAAILEMPLGTLKTRLRAAKEQLKELLD